MESEIKEIKRINPILSKLSIAFLAVLLIVCFFRAYQLYSYIFKANVSKNVVVFIPTGSNINNVLDSINSQNFIINMKAFKWVAKKKDYKNPKPGRYEFKIGMNTNELVNMLRFGKQAPVKLTFNNVRTFEELAGKVAKYLEPDSATILQAFQNDQHIDKYGWSKPTFPAMFIPNTYEFYWTTKAESFIERMNTEYKRYWNHERTAKAVKQGMNMVEVSILASIVQEETNKNNEKPVVAGLYLNRLKRGMMLQADPTVKFALKDFAVRRVTNEMLLIDSPYNTYKYSGLPPGPINFPEVTSIDAVLNAQNHNYLYMCAKEDFSGYHNFATNLTQHNNNAAKYRSELNRRKIWK